MEFLSVIVNPYMCLLCDILKQKSLKISCIFSKNMLKEFELKREELQEFEDELKKHKGYITLGQIGEA